MAEKWKIGDPQTPAIIAKGQRTKAANRAEARIVDVRTALQRFVAMDMAELDARTETRTFEFIAKSLIKVACTNGKDQLRAIQEIMDRLYGKNKPTPEVPREVGRRATIRRTLDQSGTASMEAELRRMGLDAEADKVAALWHEQNSEGNE